MSEKRVPMLVELVIPPQSKPVHLLVSVERGPDWPLDDEGERYFYEEHTCPMNWIGDVVAIRVGDDTDPHGVAKYVKTVLAPPERNDSKAEDVDLWQATGWRHPYDEKDET